MQSKTIKWLSIVGIATVAMVCTVVLANHVSIRPEMSIGLIAGPTLVGVIYLAFFGGGRIQLLALAGIAILAMVVVTVVQLKVSNPTAVDVYPIDGVAFAGGTYVAFFGRKPEGPKA